MLMLARVFACALPARPLFACHRRSQPKTAGTDQDRRRHHEVQIDFKEIKGQEHVKRALDEFPEFGSRMLEMLRQPIENKVVTISRASESLTFPANFMLVAAMTSYPCGYYGDRVKECTCSPAQVTSYQKRISGPLLDRIDIQIQVPRVD